MKEGNQKNFLKYDVRKKNMSEDKNKVISLDIIISSLNHSNYLLTDPLKLTLAL